MIIVMKPCRSSSLAQSTSQSPSSKTNKAQRSLPLPFLKPVSMSIQDKNAGFEINDTEFPELSAKLAGRKEKGRRSAVAARHARQAEKAGAMLVKTIDDPNQVLGKRRKERVSSECNDGFAANVAYSMNKNNRWNDVNAVTLLENTSELPVRVIERVITAKGKTANVTSLHTLRDDGEHRVETASGKGTSMNSITTGEGKKQRGRKARKEAAEAAQLEELDHEKEGQSTDASDIEAAGSQPSVQYTIYKPHKNHKVLAGKLFNRSYNTKKAGKARAQKKRIPVDDLEVSELEQSIHLDEPYYSRSEQYKFCLGDFLTEESHTGKPTAPVFVRRQSIESVQQDADTIEDEIAPEMSPLLDISGILKAPVIFETIYLDVSKYDDFNFPKQVEALQSDKRVDVQWLDADKSRASVDISRKASEEPHATPIAILIIEKTLMSRKPFLKFLFNADIAPPSQAAWHIFLRMLNKSSNLRLQDLISIFSSSLQQWCEKKCYSATDKAMLSRFQLKRDYFQPAFNGNAFSKPAKVVTAENMASLVREEGRRISASGEAFERIDFDNDDIDFLNDSLSESEEAVETEKVNHTRKCALCESAIHSKLFELDDCWQCGDCLRQQIIEKIRAKSVPLDIPFVVCEGQSAYDILPAIIPLPLLNFYTKTAAIDMLKNSDVSIGDVDECPSCKQLVHIERPNQYNTCNCVSCGIHWCTGCRYEPHWPMTCSSFAQWIPKWEREYRGQILNDEEYMLKKIMCNCGKAVFLNSSNCATCQSCKRVFNPQNLMAVNEEGRSYFIMPFEYVQDAKTIKKEISTACGQARMMRFESSEKNEFERAVRKLKNQPGVEKLREIRKTVLTLVENGLAFVYTEKKTETGSLKQNLMQLMKLWLEIENEVQYPRTDFTSRIGLIEANVSKTFELIKSLI